MIGSLSGPITSHLILPYMNSESHVVVVDLSLAYRYIESWTSLSKISIIDEGIIGG